METLLLTALVVKDAVYLHHLAVAQITLHQREVKFNFIKCPKTKSLVNIFSLSLKLFIIYCWQVLIQKDVSVNILHTAVVLTIKLMLVDTRTKDAAASIAHMVAALTTLLPLKTQTSKDVCATRSSSVVVLMEFQQLKDHINKVIFDLPQSNYFLKRPQYILDLKYDRRFIYNG